VLRLEPSLLIGPEEIDRLLRGLEQVCEMLDKQDPLPLVYPLIESRRVAPRMSVRDFKGACVAATAPQAPLPSRAPMRPTRKVAFVGHLTGPEELRQIDPSLADLTNDELRALVLKMSGSKQCAPYPPLRIQSPLGSAVELIFHPMWVMPEQMARWLGSGELEDIRGDIEAAIRQAQRGGCDTVGLGMYTSVATNGCTALCVPGVGLTSGNALTVAMAVAAVDRAVGRRCWHWQELTVAVVGAGSSIAATYAAMLAERAPHLLLLAEAPGGSLQRARGTAFSVYEECWQRIVESGGKVSDGIPGRLTEEALIGHWLAKGAPEASERGRLIHEALVARYGADPLIKISDNLQDLAQAQVVLCTAHAPLPFLEPEMFQSRAVICDMPVPQNVKSDNLAARPDLLYVRGGIVSTPNGESLHPGARAFLGEGQLLACMAEAAVLGLAGLSGHYSYGAISRQQVIEVAALAAAHGFRLADFKTSDLVGSAGAIRTP
jgi:predicted amino acid dehydrogenase